MPTLRTFTNKSGEEYDAENTETVFAEDMNAVSKALKGIDSDDDAEENVVYIKGAKVGVGTEEPSMPFDVEGIYGNTNFKVGAALAFYLISNWPQIGFNAYFGPGGWTFGKGSNGHYGGSIALDPVNGKLNLRISTSTGNEDATFGTMTTRVTIDKDGNVGIGATSPTAFLDINSNKIRLRTAKTPSSSSDTGNAGDICWDSNYLYICVATNTWKRIALSTW